MKGHYPHLSDIQLEKRNRSSDDIALLISEISAPFDNRVFDDRDQIVSEAMNIVEMVLNADLDRESCEIILSELISPLAYCMEKNAAKRIGDNLGVDSSRVMDLYDYGPGEYDNEDLVQSVNLTKRQLYEALKKEFDQHPTSDEEGRS